MMGPSLWFLYAAMGVAAFIFVVGYVPETKGKSLEEISRQWRTASRAHRRSSVASRGGEYAVDSDHS